MQAALQSGAGGRGRQPLGHRLDGDGRRQRVLSCRSVLAIGVAGIHASEPRVLATCIHDAERSHALGGVLMDDLTRTMVSAGCVEIPSARLDVRDSSGAALSLDLGLDE